LKKAKQHRKVDIKISTANNLLTYLLSKETYKDYFDFGFIDADKKNIPIYYEKMLPLIRPGGLIAIDNVLWYGKVADETISDPKTTIIREFNAKLHTDNRVDISYVPLSDGITLARKI